METISDLGYFGWGIDACYILCTKSFKSSSEVTGSYLTK
jgi:hypothetical protein